MCNFETPFSLSCGWIFEDVIRRCVEAQPTYGAEWVKVSKDPKREGISTEDILLTVSAGFPDLNKML